MRFFTLLTITLNTSLICAQSLTMTFDALMLPLDTFWQGSDLSGRYQESKLVAINDFDTSWGGYWIGGFSVSTMRDTVTSDFTNLFSSIVGSGYQSNAYATVSAMNESFVHCLSPIHDLQWSEFQITNSTYAYHSMRTGDLFAKKFGGISGDDPDYLFVRVRIYEDSNATNLVSQSDVYLADFRFTDNSKDYILKEWTMVDLNPTVGFDNRGKTISFQMYSSDTGLFGMNTPAYFCIDNLVAVHPLGFNDIDLKIGVSVVEHDNKIVLSADRQAQGWISDITGKKLLNFNMHSGEHIIDCAAFTPGIYFVQVYANSSTKNVKFVR